MKGNIAKNIPNYYYSKVVDIVDHESPHHYHHAFEIYYLKSGECNYFIGNQAYKVESGDVILVPEGTIHRTNYGGVAHTRLLINCSAEYIPAAVAEQLTAVGNLYRNKKAAEQLEPIFEKIEDEYEHADEFSADVLRGYTTELLVNILRNANEHENKAHENSLVAQALQYIRQNYMNEVKLSLVAKTFSVTPEHLSRVFKKETGFGFSEYLTVLRLQKAEYMLKHEPGRAVSEVAYACGFNDGNYFSYKFKQAYGVSPIQVRDHRQDIHREKRMEYIRASEGMSEN